MRRVDADDTPSSDNFEGSEIFRDLEICGKAFLEGSETLRGGPPRPPWLRAQQAIYRFPYYGRSR